MPHHSGATVPAAAGSRAFCWFAAVSFALLLITGFREQSLSQKSIDGGIHQLLTAKIWPECRYGTPQVPGSQLCQRATLVVFADETQLRDVPKATAGTRLAYSSRQHSRLLQPQPFRQCCQPQRENVTKPQCVCWPSPNGNFNPHSRDHASSVEFPGPLTQKASLLITGKKLTEGCMHEIACKRVCSIDMDLIKGSHGSAIGGLLTESIDIQSNWVDNESNKTENVIEHRISSSPSAYGNIVRRGLATSLNLIKLALSFSKSRLQQNELNHAVDPLMSWAATRRFTCFEDTSHSERKLAINFDSASLDFLCNDQDLGLTTSRESFYPSTEESPPSPAGPVIAISNCWLTGSKSTRLGIDRQAANGFGHRVEDHDVEEAGDSKRGGDGGGDDWTAYLAGPDQALNRQLDCTEKADACSADALDSDTMARKWLAKVYMCTNGIAAQHVWWEVLALDLARQKNTPSLMSGHTVIDARNFALDWH